MISALMVILQYGAVQYGIVASGFIRFVLEYSTGVGPGSYPIRSPHDLATVIGVQRSHISSFFFSAAYIVVTLNGAILSV